MDDYIEIEETIKILKNKFEILPQNIRELYVNFLNDNNWFDLQPTYKEEKTYIRKEEFKKLLPRILFYFENINKPLSERIKALSDFYYHEFPLTVTKINIFSSEVNLKEEYKYRLLSFILRYLNKELLTYNDEEIKNFLELVYQEESIVLGNVLICFLNYLQKKYETDYKIRVSEMKPRAIPNNTSSSNNDKMFLKLFHLLTNPQKIKEQNLIFYACKNKTTCDAWLYILLHFITAQRDTDLLKIPHPIIPYKPEIVIEKIINDEFKEPDALKIIIQYESYYKYLAPKPNKTKNNKNTPALQFHFPESLKQLFGKIFALAEAHHQRYQLNNSEPLIKQINEYKQIKNYLGEEIAQLFLKADFNARAMNKAYMQHIYQITIMAYDNQDNYDKRYLTASVSRSHKINEFSLPEITNLYLKSPLKTSDVEKMLFERGVLGFETKLTLELLTNKESQYLSEIEQTDLIKTIPLSPHQQESFIRIYNETYEKAKKTVKTLFSECNNDKEKIINTLKSIATGQATSKTEGILCFKTGLGKRCVYPEKSHCFFCEYHVFTKAIALVIAKEIYSHKLAINTTDNEYSKKKHKAIFKKLTENFTLILFEIKEKYGKDALKQIEEVIKEVISSYEQ